jgi:hypothetical protein
MSRAGWEKNRLNGNLKETSLIKHMITVLTDEKPIWQKWLYSMRFETSMYEIWSMTVYYNKLKDHRSYRRKWDRKEGPSTRKGRLTQNDRLKWLSHWKLVGSPNVSQVQPLLKGATNRRTAHRNTPEWVLPCRAADG